jgi:hypothetical protein
MVTPRTQQPEGNENAENEMGEVALNFQASLSS